MMGILRRSLLAKLLLYFLVLCIMPLCVIGFFAYQTGRDSLSEEVEGHIESVAILKEQEIGNWIEHLSQTMAFLSEDEGLRGEAEVLTSADPASAAYAAARKSIADRFRRIALFRDFEPLILLDTTSGQVLASDHPEWEGKIRATEPYFAAGIEGLYVSNVHHNLSLGRPTLVVSIPLQDESGQVTGVIAGHANLDALTEIMMERAGLGDTGETFLVNEYNLLITHTVFAPEGAFQKWIFGEGAKWALEGRDGSGTFTDYRGKPVIGAYRWVDNLELALIAKQDRSEALAGIDDLRTTIFWVVGAIIAVVALASVFFARTITEPVRRLVAGTHEIGHGNLDHRIQGTGRDELGRLGAAFNRMASDLKTVTASRDELNREIDERRRAEAERDRILTFSQDPICVSGMDGFFKYVNPAWEGLLGYSTQELLSRPFLDLIHPDDHGRTDAEVARLSAGLKTVDFENRYICKDGSIRHILWIATPFLDEGAMYCIGHDITERKRAEREISEWKIRYETAIQASGHLLYDWDSVTNSVTYGGDIPRILGYGADEMGGGLVHWMELIHPDDRAYFNKAIDELVKTRQAAHLEYRVRRNDGEYIAVEDEGYFIVDARGEAIRMIGFVKDITERKRWEEELARHRQHLEELVEERTGELREAQEQLVRQERLATLGQVAGSISHEIRNPLGVISNSAYLLRQKLAQSEPKVLESLARIESGVKSCTRIVQSLLDLTRMQEPEMEPLDLSVSVAEVVEGDEIPGGVSVVRHIPDEPVMAAGDREQLRIAFRNIVANAVAAMEQEGTLTVHLGDGQDGMAELSFEDSGPGISPENLETIFQPLFTTKARGIGFGLSIARTVIEKHGGTIEARSEVGKGTSMIVRLPRGQQ